MTKVVTASRKRIRGGLIVLMLLSATAISFSERQRRSRAHPVEEMDEGDTDRFGDIFQWQKDGPLDFLKLLKDRVNATPPFYTVVGRHVGWIQETDIPGLIELVESREPCLHVVSVRSSSVPRELSFVGQEALFLVEGYRQGRYPPNLRSTGF